MSPPQPNPTAPLSPSRGAARLETTIQVHDFGTVICDGTPLTHRFQVANRSDRPVRILQAASSKPCCARIGEFPTIIPPGRAIDVPVTLQTRDHSGPLFVEFFLRAHQQKSAPLQLAIKANLIEEFNFERLEGSETLTVGQPSRLKCRITHRLAKTADRSSPTLEMAKPFRAQWVGESQEKAENEGIVERRYDAVVEAPALERSGRLQTELKLRWENGRVWSRVLSWEVKPSVEALPAALTIRKTGEPTEQTLVVRSADRPIAILKVEGDSLQDYRAEPDPSKPAKQFRVAVRLAAPPDSRSADAVEIVTDHPQFSRLRIPVIFLSGKE